MVFERKELRRRRGVLEGFAFTLAWDGCLTCHGLKMGLVVGLQPVRAPLFVLISEIAKAWDNRPSSCSPSIVEFMQIHFFGIAFKGRT